MWGNWCLPAVRLPTEQLEVQLAFPRRPRPGHAGHRDIDDRRTLPAADTAVRSDDGGLRQFTRVHDHAVRGLPGLLRRPRARFPPLKFTVETTTLFGETVTTVSEHGLDRLDCHEIDRLDGLQPRAEGVESS